MNKIEFRRFSHRKKFSIRWNLLRTTSVRLGVCGRVRSAQSLETYLQGVRLIYYNQLLTHLDCHCWNTDTDDSEDNCEDNNGIKDEIYQCKTDVRARFCSLHLSKMLKQL